jgi:hypothetical protein
MIQCDGHAPPRAIATVETVPVVIGAFADAIRIAQAPSIGVGIMPASVRCVTRRPSFDE